MCLTRARKIHSSCFKNCPARQELHAVWIWCILRLHKHGPSWEEKKQRRRMQHKSPFFIRRCPYFVQQLFTLLNCKANVTCPTGTCSNSSCIYWVQDNHSSINTFNVTHVIILNTNQEQSRWGLRAICLKLPWYVKANVIQCSETH